MNDPVLCEYSNNFPDALVRINELERAIDRAIEAMEFTLTLYSFKEESTLVKAMRELERVREV